MCLLLPDGDPFLIPCLQGLPVELKVRVTHTSYKRPNLSLLILTTNLAECVCVCAKCDAFLPVRSHFFFKLPDFFFRIAKFPCAAFGPLFACHCPIFFTKNNTLNGVYAECNSGPLK